MSSYVKELMEFRIAAPSPRTVHSVTVGDGHYSRSTVLARVTALTRIGYLLSSPVAGRIEAPSTGEIRALQLAIAAI